MTWRSSHCAYIGGLCSRKGIMVKANKGQGKARCQVGEVLRGRWASKMGNNTNDQPHRCPLQAGDAGHSSTDPDTYAHATSAPVLLKLAHANTPGAGL